MTDARGSEVVDVVEEIPRGSRNKYEYDAAASDPHFTEVKDIVDIASHRLREIETFFATYEILQGVETQVVGWRGVEVAWEVIRSCRQAAKGSKEAM